MKSDTLIRQLAEADVYAPDHELPDSARTSTVALTEIRRRIDMDAKELTKPVTPDRPPQRPWLVLVAAAAAVALIVGVVAVLARGGDDVAPATVPTTTLEGSPTTTVASPTTTLAGQSATSTTFAEPELNEAEVAYVQALVDELNAGDQAAVAARIASAATFEGPESAGDGQIDDRGRTADRWAVWTELESVIELTECTTLSTGGTRCEFARTTPLDFSAPDPELSFVQVRLDDSGAVAYMRTAPVTGAWNTTYAAFEVWVNENHPEQYMTLFFNFTDPAETAALFREYYPQFLEDTGRS